MGEGKRGRNTMQTPLSILWQFWLQSHINVLDHQIQNWNITEGPHRLCMILTTHSTPKPLALSLQQKATKVFWGGVNPAAGRVVGTPRRPVWGDRQVAPKSLGMPPCWSPPGFRLQEREFIFKPDQSCTASLPGCTIPEFPDSEGTKMQKNFGFTFQNTSGHSFPKPRFPSCKMLVSLSNNQGPSKPFTGFVHLVLKAAEWTFWD